MQKVLEELKYIEHPIARAAYLWFQIVKIHPWHEANKRTGKALASLILLQHGYLPPLITKEDEPRYRQVFLKNFDKPNGHRAFISYIAELIVKTQEKFKGKKF